ncbi:hypothetical protein AB204_18160 [Xenorhabdus khoisanae]|uniref:Uncharacterized protein n=1 Tax=Xenorhabdus khoisanae TaxID=880157 RepID=A0A0J5FN57_9GAMM|nr:hypothetical protein AB204_18160 [Xenorhabdus khoisanae]
MARYDIPDKDKFTAEFARPGRSSLFGCLTVFNTDLLFNHIFPPSKVMNSHTSVNHGGFHLSLSAATLYFLLQNHHQRKTPSYSKR